MMSKEGQQFKRTKYYRERKRTWRLIFENFTYPSSLFLKTVFHKLRGYNIETDKLIDKNSFLQQLKTTETCGWQKIVILALKIFFEGKCQPTDVTRFIIF